MTTSFSNRILSSMLVLACIEVQAQESPSDDPLVQRMLRIMASTTTWYHPDLFGEFSGMRRYAHGQFKGAMEDFQTGAFYADKMSQLSIGLMYLNGEGVAKNPTTAYAWIDLAAERGYPEFVATRDRVKSTLSPEQFASAITVRDNLARTYGDAVAKPRMIVQLRLGQMQLTGSHTGFDSGLHNATAALSGSTPSMTLLSSPLGCGSIYSMSCWKPEEYFALRDAAWKATVRVGAIEMQDDKNKSSGATQNH